MVGECACQWQNGSDPLTTFGYGPDHLAPASIYRYNLHSYLSTGDSRGSSRVSDEANLCQIIFFNLFFFTLLVGTFFLFSVLFAEKVIDQQVRAFIVSLVKEGHSSVS